jgi:hypothetical protein
MVILSEAKNPAGEAKQGRGAEIEMDASLRSEMKGENPV